MDEVPSDEYERKIAETRIWLQILNLKSAIFKELNGALSAQHGLSVAKFEFLAQLERYPEGVSLGQLSSNLKVTSGNISGLVRRLQADGLITRSMSPDDRRSFVVRFTTKGKVAFNKANEVHASVLRDCFSRVSSPDLENTFSTLKFLLSRVRGRHDA